LVFDVLNLVVADLATASGKRSGSQYWTPRQRFGSNTAVVRVCTDCQLTKPLDAFTPIRGTSGYYGRCKACRARRAWERAHPGRDYEARERENTEPRASVDRRAREARLRVCTDCGATKAVAEFVPIRACKQGWYGRCRACRAKRARERYQSDPLERERQKARVRRNRLRRRAVTEHERTG
jgi:hypothetical protein